MKRLLCVCAILLCLVGVSSADGLVIQGAAAGECDGYLVCQNFEGTGYDNSETWVEGAANPDEDYTTTVLRGSQSLYLNDTSTAYTYINFTEASEVWGHFLFRTSDATPATDKVIGSVRNSSDVSQGQLRVDITGYLEGVCGSVTATDTTTALADNTTYHIWHHYLKGTGANAVFQIWVGTTVNRSEATLVVDISTGTSTYDVTRHSIALQASDNSITSIVDQVYLDNAAITTVPN